MGSRKLCKWRGKKVNSREQKYFVKVNVIIAHCVGQLHIIFTQSWQSKTY